MKTSLNMDISARLGNTEITFDNLCYNMHKNKICKLKEEYPAPIVSIKKILWV